MFKCKFCESIRDSKKSLIAHECTCPKNPDGYRNIPWNKGKTKESSFRLKEISLRMTGTKRLDISSKLKGRKTGIGGRASTPEKEKERKRKIAEKAKLNNGGYREGSGRGKKGWYKGIFCDSSWELAFVIYHIDNNIDIKRNIIKYKYFFEGKEFNYIPDFIVENETIEIKGYWTEKNKEKIKQCSVPIKIIGKKEIKFYIEYVVEKYGKNFIDLYE